MKNNASLKVKFMKAMMFAALASVFVATVSLAAYNTLNYKNQLNDTVQAHATFLSRAVRPAIEFNDAKSATSYADLVESLPGVLAASIYDEHGALFAGSGYHGIQYQGPHRQGTRVAGGVITAYQPVVNSDGTVAELAVTMKYDFTKKLLFNALIAMGVFLVAGGVGLALSMKLEKQVTRPILHVSDMAKEFVEKRDYSVRAKKFSDDETGILVDAFNAMLDEVAHRDAALKESNRQLHAEIEERTEAEKALLASERAVKDHALRLESVNQELESFCYSVSHDLRTPLRAIDGFSQAILEDYDDLLDEVGSDYLARVRKATQRMGRLIDDLLKLSRVSRADLNTVEVNISKMVLEVADELAMTEPDRAVEFTIAPDLKGEFDAPLIKIVLENLVGNAWKYTGRKEHGHIEFDRLLHAGKTVYFIRDNGAGYEMKYADKLFQPFHRLHADADFPGNGIGLATVRRILRRHGGDIWSEARLDEGAVFYFTLARFTDAEKAALSLYRDKHNCRRG